MSFHGGLLGIILAMIIYSNYKKINFFQISDLVSTVAPLGIFFGRIANFINVELYGRITQFPFAIIYPNIDNMPRHPSQIYEAFFEGIILFIILYIFSKKNFAKNKFGFSTSLFLILYGIFRFFLEFIREPDAHLGLYYDIFTVGQFLSIPMIFVGIVIISKMKNA
jgi:phosphatidylglycerol:prolipoprotein diacylglycerol transferase